MRFYFETTSARTSSLVSDTNGQARSGSAIPKAKERSTLTPRLRSCGRSCRRPTVGLPGCRNGMGARTERRVDERQFLAELARSPERCGSLG
jgi:hypothetical protein